MAYYIINYLLIIALLIYFQEINEFTHCLLCVQRWILIAYFWLINCMFLLASHLIRVVSHDNQTEVAGIFEYFVAITRNVGYCRHKNRKYSTPGRMMSRLV